jgi:hypothetical protein
MINITNSDIIDIAIGSTPIEKAYIGSTLVWEKAPSAKDYIQNGLVAMWDGIENIGWKQHSDSASTWVNLMGNSNYDFALKNNASWASDGLITNLDYVRAAESTSSIAYASNLTTEIVFEIYAVPSEGRQIFFKLGNTVAIGSSNRIMRCLAFNPGSPLGWQFKSNSVMTNSGYNTPPINTPLSIAIVYAVPSGSAADRHAQNPNRILINNQIQTPTWSSNGFASSFTGMTISAISSSNGFYGKVHAIRIYNRQLSNTEIGQNYLIDKQRFGI